jgi:hypothetical protein
VEAGFPLKTKGYEQIVERYLTLNIMRKAFSAPRASIIPAASSPWSEGRLRISIADISALSLFTAKT